MTTNHHTPHAASEALTSANQNAPLSELDSVITNILAGSQAFTRILGNSVGQAVTIDGAGAAVISQLFAVLTSNTGTSDNLDTITMSGGTFAFIRAASGHTITFRDGIDNIHIVGGNNFSITGNQAALVFASGSQISVIGHDGNTGGGGGITASSTDTLTNKTISGSNNTITNIGASEVESSIINNQTVENTIDAANDTIVFYDNSASALRKTAINNLPSSSGALSEITAATELGSSTATISLTSIPATYHELMLIVRARTTSGVTPQLYMQFNSDTGTNYGTIYELVTSTSESHTNTTNQNEISIPAGVASNTATANYFGYICIRIAAYADGGKQRNGSFTATNATNASTLLRSQGNFAWENVADAISSIQLNLQSGNFDTGTEYALYGIGTAI